MKTRSVIPGLRTFDYNWLEQGAGFAAMSVCDNCLVKALVSLGFKKWVAFVLVCLLLALWNRGVRTGGMKH